MLSSETTTSPATLPCFTLPPMTSGMKTATHVCTMIEYLGPLAGSPESQSRHVPEQVAKLFV